MISAPALVSAGNPDDLVKDALERSGGDLELAASLLAKDLSLLVSEVEYLERDIQVKDNALERCMTQKKAVEPGFLEKLADSTLFKVGLFVAGVYLGREMVKIK